MALSQQEATQLLSQYAPRIASMLGGTVPPDLRVKVMDPGAYAKKYPGTGAYSLQGNLIAVPSNTPDPARIIAYETAHQLAAGPGVSTTMGANGLLGNKAGKASEALSGVITNKLGLTPADWTPDARQARFMQLSSGQLRAVGQDLEAGSYTSIRDSIGGNVQPPTATGGSSAVGGQDNRHRNTAANQLSKYQTDYQNPGGMAALPALSPAQTENQFAQLAGLAATFQNTVADLRAKRVGLKAGWAAQKAAIHAQEMADLSSTENSNISRGVTGSSASNASLIGVQAGAASASQAGKAALYQGLAENRIAGQRAAIDLFSGQTSVQAQGLAMQQDALANQLQNDLIISGQETTTDYVRQLYASLLAQVQPPNAVAPGAAGRVNRFNRAGVAGAQAYVGPGGQMQVAGV